MKRKLACVQMYSCASLGGKIAGMAILETLREWLPGTRIWVAGEPLGMPVSEPGESSLPLSRLRATQSRPLHPRDGTGGDPPRPVPRQRGGYDLTAHRVCFRLDARPGAELVVADPRGGLSGARRELILACLPYLARSLRESRPCRGPFAAESRSAMLVVDRAGRVQYQSPGAAELTRMAGLLSDAAGDEPSGLTTLIAAWLLDGGEHSHELRFTASYGHFHLRLEALDGASGRIFGVGLHHHEPLSLRLLRRLRRLAVPPKQQEVCLLLCFGHNTTAVAERLGLSSYTVAEHVQNLYRRLGVEGNTAALLDVFYREPGLPGGRTAPFFQADMPGFDVNRTGTTQWPAPSALDRG